MLTGAFLRVRWATVGRSTRQQDKEHPLREIPDQHTCRYPSCTKLGTYTALGPTSEALTSCSMSEGFICLDVVVSGGPRSLLMPLRWRPIRAIQNSAPMSPSHEDVGCFAIKKCRARKQGREEDGHTRGYSRHTASTIRKHEGRRACRNKQARYDSKSSCPVRPTREPLGNGGASVSDPKYDTHDPQNFWYVNQPSVREVSNEAQR
jgi:hypothetical protein